MLPQKSTILIWCEGVVMPLKKKNIDETIQRNVTPCSNPFGPQKLKESPGVTIQ